MMSETECLEWLEGLAQDLPSTVGLGIGDDAAVLNCPPDRQLTVSQDLLVEDVHFRKNRIHPRLLGRKALLVNLSDLAAMGSTPIACLLSLALPSDLHRSYLEDVVSGLLREAQKWTCPLIGGDLSRSSRVVANVTVLGSVPRGTALLRKGAAAGDSIVVIGPLGLSRLGLEILEQLPPEQSSRADSEETIGSLADSPFGRACLMAHLLPRPQLKAADWLRREQLANAAIDVSDGLSVDLRRLARASGLQAVIDLHEILLPQNEESGRMSREAVLDGGEDYALLFTASEKQMASFRASYPRDWDPFRVIGIMQTGDPGVWVRDGVALEHLEPRGFDHFR